MSDRAAMQQAQLDVITVTLMREGINKHRARELADHFVNFTLTPPLPVQEPVGYVKGTYAGRLIYDTINPAVCLPVGMALYTAPLPVQEPTPWRDMVVVSLVREGINKHKARELADHFAAQPVQEPIGEVVEVNNDGFKCEFSQHLPVGTKLYTTPPPPVQEPWGACVSGRVFVGRLPEHARKISEDEGAPIQLLYTAPPQRPWVGLTEQDMPSGEDSMFDHQFFIAGMVYAAKILQEKNT